jgi:hypothetical protein
MHQTEHRSLADADEVRGFPSGHADIVKVGDSVDRYASNDAKGA